MPDVEDRRTPLTSAADFVRRAVAVLREQRIAVEGADAAAVVGRLRQRISNESREAGVQPTRELHRERVVFRFGDVADGLQPGEFGVGPPRRGQAGPRDYLVAVEHALELPGAGAEIA